MAEAQAGTQGCSRVEVLVSKGSPTVWKKKLSVFERFWSMALDTVGGSPSCPVKKCVS